MNDEQIVEEVKKIVENIVRERLQQEFYNTKGLEKKAVAKRIISELEQVMEDED